MPEPTRPSFIRPIEAANEPLSPLRPLVERYGPDAVVRAIDAGLEVFDAGRVLMAHHGAFRVINDLFSQAWRSNDPCG